MPFNMAMKYVNHKNQVISLGDGGPLHYFANTIRDWEWTANEVNGKVSSFTRSPIDKDLPIGIAAETEEDGLLLRDQLYEYKRLVHRAFLDVVCLRELSF